MAQRAGTSTAVVSYVVNGGPRAVSPGTRARVEAAVEVLGYRPHRIAGALAGRRSGALGLVVSDIANPFIGELACAVELAASGRGLTVLLGNSMVDPGRERRLVGQFLDRRVDGLLLVAVGLDDALVAELNLHGPPTVALDRPVPGLEALTMLCDNVGGTEAVVGHLVDHGHRRVACVAGPSALHPAQVREQAWAATVAAAGLAPGRCPVVRTSVGRRAGYEAGLELLGRRCPPTAIFATSDEQAIGVLRAAADVGARVPDDVAVGAFDGIAQSAFTVPGLTTARQPVDAMGRRAVHAVLDGGAQAVAGSTEVLPVGVVRRGSCGCPDTVEDGRETGRAAPFPA